jgi:hypothetical protein
MFRAKPPRRSLGPPLPDRLKEPGQRSLQIPDWVEEYFSVLVIGVCMVIFGLFSLWKFASQDPPKPIDVTTLARVVVLGPARKIFEEGSATKVQTVIVSIRNMGPADAVGVSVDATVFGKTIRLDGPGTMSRGETYDFQSKVGQHMSSNDQIQVVARCGNCR